MRSLTVLGGALTLKLHGEAGQMKTRLSSCGEDGEHVSGCIGGGCQEMVRGGELQEDSESAPLGAGAFAQVQLLQKGSRWHSPHALLLIPSHSGESSLAHFAIHRIDFHGMQSLGWYKSMGTAFVRAD